MTGSKPQPTCRKGHLWTPANTQIHSKNGRRQCRECDETRRRKYERLRHKAHPSETGVCRRGLHKWVEENWTVRQDGSTRCRPCATLAARARYRAGGIMCISKGCQRHTTRTSAQHGETYICPAHRIEPPVWVGRAGLQIVGTEVLAA